jgi:uncharacterized protein with von Willebrand factor type A (vWA) domain
MAQPEEMAVAFAAVLRGAGLGVPTDSVIAFARAMGRTGLDRRQPVYWAGRATLTRRPDDVPLYDAAFAAFWDGVAAPEPHADPDADPPDAEQTIEVETGPWSAVEVLRRKDFADYTADERDEAHRLIADLRVTAALRRSRRLRPARRGAPDVAATMRAALRTGGEPLHRRYRGRTHRPRRLILLCDVSGSMEPYARALARFLHAAVSARKPGRVEAFALGTRVTRITRELAAHAHDPDAALAAAAHAVQDWSGGTRLGEGLRAFNDRWGTRGLARGAIVVILSDGWDRGDPAILGAEMARLSRVARRVVWVNPLKASPGYAPLAQGMAAALPYVDAFVEGHSVASLDQLAKVVSTA